MSTSCRLPFCGREADGRDGLCGYHEAMEQGPEALDVWQRQQDLARALQGTDAMLGAVAALGAPGRAD